MRSYKSEFTAGGEKPIIVIRVYVPSVKRKNAMSESDLKKARKWAKETIKHCRIMLSGITGVKVKE